MIFGVINCHNEVACLSCPMQAANKGASAAAERAPLLGEAEVEDCLEDGLTEVHDFQSLLAARPKKVIKWLQEDGIQKLGEFDVQVSMPCSIRRMHKCRLHVAPAVHTCME